MTPVSNLSEKKERELVALHKIKRQKTFLNNPANDRLSHDSKESKQL